MIFYGKTYFHFFLAGLVNDRDFTQTNSLVNSYNYKGDTINSSCAIRNFKRFTLDIDLVTKSSLALMENMHNIIGKKSHDIVFLVYCLTATYITNN